MVAPNLLDFLGGLNKIMYLKAVVDGSMVGAVNGKNHNWQSLCWILMCGSYPKDLEPAVKQFSQSGKTRFLSRQRRGKRQTR